MSNAIEIAKHDFHAMRYQHTFISATLIMVAFGFFWTSSAFMLSIAAGWLAALYLPAIFVVRNEPGHNLCKAISTEHVVIGRYLYMLLVFAATCLLGIAVHTVFALAQGTPFELNLMTMGLAIALLFFSLVVGIQNPLLFKFGYKARYWMIVPFVALIAGLMIAYNNFLAVMVERFLSAVMLEQARTWLTLGCVAASFLILFVSCRIAIAVCKKSKN
ncbi:MAG: ABC-2 transporter permease [Clostridiales bacterium]|jgi:hypothetical protein|nr:ABC-2 transporter permease [Clostridiales bacterium]MDR2751041.1 ABC-2 transporter permease [Clostridiales bacterium]